MLDRLKTVLFGPGSIRTEEPGDDPDQRFAITALLVEAAMQDGSMDASEEETVRALLGRRFGLSEEAAGGLLAKVRDAVAESAQVYPHTRAIKDGLAYEDRLEVLEMCWEVAYADGVLHDYESNLMRRLAGLLHVSDVDSGGARKRAMARLDLS